MEPAGIAPVAALLSRSDFLDRLDPADSRSQLKSKLKDLRFTLDPNRGIVTHSESLDPRTEKEGNAGASR